MQKSYILHSLLILCVSFFCGCKHQADTVSSKPNVVIILADDMGFSDIGCYGGEIHTPNIDRLAGEGVRFKQFYNAARCCPTRASLLTGLYPHQAGIGHMTNSPTNPSSHNYGYPAYQGYLNRNCVTIAEVLKTSGYQTFMSGKWHLGFHGKEKWPLQRGFDKYYGTVAGGANYFNPEPPRGLTLGNEDVKPGNNFYITDAFTDHAIDFLKQANNDQPFFLYLAYTSPHWPLHALKNDIDKYRGKYMRGWAPIREARLEKMKAIGLLEKDVKLSGQAGPEWGSLPEEKKKEMDLRMAIYAAQIDRMDQNIGRLLNTLDTQGKLENTIIFFLSDNGACAEGGMLGRGKKEELEGKPKWGMISYGEAWANASNTPFREYKHWVHEGGISTPLIVHWPEGIPQKENGKWIGPMGFIQDIMATILDISKIDYPESYMGNRLHSPAGKSFLPVLQGKGTEIHEEPVFWEHEGNCAVRLGKWKLVKKYSENNASEWELYDMDRDRAEQNNLSGNNPQKVEEMKQLYEDWAKKSQVISWDIILKQKQLNRKKK